MSIDPTLKALTDAANEDKAACGPLADWYEEHGAPIAAEMARRGNPMFALIEARMIYPYWKAKGCKTGSKEPDL